MVGYDGGVDIRLCYTFAGDTQPLGSNLWGGETVTFGPHGRGSGGLWSAPQLVVGQPGIICFATSMTWLDAMSSVSFPNVSFSGAGDVAAILVAAQAANLTAQWQAYAYVIAHPY
jgi:hypothetical protein